MGRNWHDSFIVGGSKTALWALRRVWMMMWGRAGQAAGVGTGPGAVFDSHMTYVNRR